jgi:hypothetical protein
MENNDLEKYLSKFRMKAAERDLRHEILLRAKTAWAEDKHRPVWFPAMVFRPFVAYTCAIIALILVGIVGSKIDSALTFRLLDGKPVSGTKTSQYSAMEEVFADLGIDYSAYKRLMMLVQNTEDTEPDLTGLIQREQLFKELGVTMNGGPS